MDNKGAFWGKDNVLYLDMGLGYTGVHLPKLSAYMLTVYFAVCKFYIERKALILDYS